VFTISAEKTFNASHQLKMPDGSKEPVHSHDWVVVVTVCSEKLDEMGLVMDFDHLKNIIDQAVESLENTQLEQTGCFAYMNSSAENVARYLYEKVAGLLPTSVKLKCVRVTEAPGCTAEYGR